MRFRNKKTGEIGHLTTSRGIDHYLVANDEWESRGKYDTLAELMAEWEEYEEPKCHWAIDTSLLDGDLITDFEDLGCDWQESKEIGNYFETKEEAEKAVEKLKAWKRLKDKGFKFNDYHIPAGEIYFDMEIPKGSLDKIAKDFAFLFGGEK